MDKEIILCFMNNRAREYWFRGAIEYLKEYGDGINLYFTKEYKIITNGKVLHFITEEQKEKFLIGRHNAKLYYDAQDLFDTDFFRTVKEILNGEERRN